MELEIIYLSPHDLTPYENNARKHAPEDVGAIKKSIERFGFDDPIGIWGDKNIIVEGHGRQIAAIEMGLDKVPCIRLDHLTEAQRRAYALAHNKTAELSDWGEKLEEELAAAAIDGFDMSEFGFDSELEADLDEQNPYSSNVKIPQYDVTGAKPQLQELFDTQKVNELITEIEASGVTEDEKEFLRYAAYRHAAFNFRNIAEYYANATPEMQSLMEKSALVIIDLDDAIANGYAKLQAEIEDMAEEQEGA